MSTEANERGWKDFFYSFLFSIFSFVEFVKKKNCNEWNEHQDGEKEFILVGLRDPHF